MERNVANGGCKTGRTQLDARLRSHAFRGSPGAAICGRPWAFPVDAEGWRGGAMRGRAGDRPRIVRSDGTTDGTEKSRLEVCQSPSMRGVWRTHWGPFSMSSRARSDSRRRRCKDRTDPSPEGRGALLCREDRHFQGRPLSGESRPAFAPGILDRGCTTRSKRAWRQSAGA